MESSVPRPETINKLIFAADSAFAMLAGMQLDVFTPLRGGPMTAEDIAHAIGVSGPARLRLSCCRTVDRTGRAFLKHLRSQSIPGKGRSLVHGQQARTPVPPMDCESL